MSRESRERRRRNQGKTTPAVEVSIVPPASTTHFAAVKEEDRRGVPEFLGDLCKAVREGLQIGTEVGPDCCILATRVLVGVLESFRVRSRPLSVMAGVFNPTMRERILSGDAPVPEGPGASRLPDGCWSVGLGAGFLPDGRRDTRPARWRGHLVAVVEDTVLVDLTIAQANRPDRGIVLPEVFITDGIRGDFLAGRVELECLVNGCGVIYQARPEDHSFEQAPDWTERERRDRCIGPAVFRFKARRAE